MLRNWILGIVFGSVYGLSMAQDSMVVLSQERFIEMVLKYHPIARQSNLVLEQGEYGIKKARGNFGKNDLNAIFSGNIGINRAGRLGEKAWLEILIDKVIAVLIFSTVVVILAATRFRKSLD